MCRGENSYSGADPSVPQVRVGQEEKRHNVATESFGPHPGSDNRGSPAPFCIVFNTEPGRAEGICQSRCALLHGTQIKPPARGQTFGGFSCERK